MRSNQAYKLLYSNVNYKQNEKKTYGSEEEDICKWCNQQGLNFQDTQTAHTTQWQKTNNTAENGQKAWTDASPKKIDKQPAQTLSIPTVREAQVKTARETAMRCHLTQIKAASIKKCKQQVRRCGGKGTLLHGWWECKLAQSLWKTVRKFLKPLKIE